MMAITQIRHATDGRVLYRRKLAERKTDKEALRALKRQLSNVVYRRLFDDYQSGKIRQLPKGG